MTDDMTVRVRVQARFAINPRNLADAYVMAGTVAEKLRIDLTECGSLAEAETWEVTALDIQRDGEIPKGLPVDRPINVEMIRVRMAELHLNSCRDVARRSAIGPNPISHTTVNLILRGDQPNPGARTRRKLALALDMPADWLY